MNNLKNLLFSILFTNLICTYAAGHGIIPLGFLEYLTLISIISGNFVEFPFISLWTLASLSTLTGQILIMTGLLKKDTEVIYKFGKYGTIFLLISLLLVFISLPDQIWFISLLTSTPFLILTIILWRTINSKKSNN